MVKKEEKKNIIREQIIEAAKVYGQELAGKTFLYVYGEESFEVYFPIENFLHLTGVATRISAKEFYKNAKNATLATGQFYFDERHIYSNAKKKLPCLMRLPELTNSMVCVLRELKTVKIVYKLSLTNLEFTLGLVENVNAEGEKVNELFLPMTLRVKDSSVEKSSSGEIVDFIFEKDASRSKYDAVLVADKNKEIPQSVLHLIAEDLL